MLKKLPDLIDPISAVSHDKHFIGSVNQADLKRLMSVVLKEHSVEVDLKFYFNKAAKLPAATLKLKTLLALECQRSLEPFDFVVDSEVDVVFLETMALADDVPSDIEIFELDGEKISLYQWVEEELLLVMPMVPMKQDSQMPQFENDFSEKGEENAETVTKQNPFAALKVLKK